jgi:hypothetical protein
MPHICNVKHYRIIKSCGDNGSKSNPARHATHDPVTGGYGIQTGEDAPLHNFLVEPHVTYFSREAAEKRAKQLSKETPGNRYYVVEAVSGFISRKPKTYKRSYR